MSAIYWASLTPAQWDVTPIEPSMKPSQITHIHSLDKKDHQIADTDSPGGTWTENLLSNKKKKKKKKKMFALYLSKHVFFSLISPVTVIKPFICKHDSITFRKLQYIIACCNCNSPPPPCLPFITQWELRSRNWVHFAHRLLCTVTLNSNFAILKTWNCFQLE